MRAACVFLYSLGLLLPVGSAVIGYRRVRDELRRQRDLLNRAQEELRRGDSRTASERAGAILPATSTWSDALYSREVVAVAILESDWRQLRVPAFVAGIGLLCSTVASIWSLWL
ncbi:MAG: hypothetical protein M3P96_12170 [Actinomycetota bacterium]|nr:hypothetical protein [Actinomycetota bacterium]